MITRTIYEVLPTSYLTSCSLDHCVTSRSYRHSPRFDRIYPWCENLQHAISKSTYCSIQKAQARYVTIQCL